jgi:DNA replication factor GINS
MVRLEDDNEIGVGVDKTDTVTGNDLLSIRDIYALLLKEVQLSQLQSVPIDTYQRIATVISNLKGQGYEGLEAKIRDYMVELISTSAKLLLELRYYKIIEEGSVPSAQLLPSYFANGGGNGISTTGNSLDYSKLTDEEKFIMDGKRDAEKRKESIISATLRGRTKVLEHVSSKVMSKQVIVRFVKPLEQFIGVDMVKYGPFQQEDVAVLPFENARSLIENGEVVEISF